MLFNKITPERAGVKSSAVRKYIKTVQKRDIPLHSLLMMKGEDIFCECYWKPYTVDSNHRMYSQTKSYVSIAIGLLEEDGKLSLSDKIADHFPEKIKGPVSEFVSNLTIEEMLKMSTAGFNSDPWFTSSCIDRTEIYFKAPKIAYRPSGTLWGYDSLGSQVLSSLVEKLSGKTLFDFLDERIFSHLGTFKGGATVLKTKNGDSWGDSALLCTARDMASFARFVMNYGKWNGKQLLNEEYLRKATSPLVSNQHSYRKFAFRFGYGYQIWCADRGGFAFVGMGNQLTVCFPKEDVIFVCTADCQGDDGISREQLLNYFYDFILDDMSSESLPEDPEEYALLEKESASLELFALKGMPDAPIREKINGVEYECIAPNKMGLEKFSFTFDGDKGVMKYTNAQGDKELPFGINHNEFGKFPQLGYSNEFGGLRTTDGFMYDDAVSAAWLDEHQLGIYVQIIDRYLGNLLINVSFKDDYASVQMIKTAEDFLEEYQGDAVGKIKK